MTFPPPVVSTRVRAVFRPLTDYDVLDSAETPIGLIYLSRRELLHQPGVFVHEVRIDSDLLMSSVSPLSERQIATSALALHHGDGPLRVLVGGLGLGYTAQAALESPRPSVVRVVDQMDFVIRWMRDGLLPISAELNADPRLQLVQGNMYAQLLGPADEQWDVIIVDIDHSPDGPLDRANEVFYTVEGQERVAEHLAPGGILAVWSACDHDHFAAVLGASYAEASREHVRWTVPYPGTEDQNLHNVLFFARKD